MLKFANDLSTTPLSKTIQDVLWVIPVIQCVHILAISIVMGSVLMTNLRILELAGRAQTMTNIARRFMPWLWWGLLVALLSGLVMIVGEPVRELVNPAFWAKMIVLALSMIAAAAFQTTLGRTVAVWERSSAQRKWTRISAVLALLAWVAIVVLGRWIAYAQTVT